jgi:hypothetical protein
MASDQINRKRRQIGWSESVSPLPDNQVIDLLAAYGIPSTRIYGQRCTGFDLTNKEEFEDYDVYIYGISKDEQLPRTLFDWITDGGRGYYCWQIQIYWRKYPTRIEALWCELCGTYHVNTDWGNLTELDARLVKGMNEGMKILLEIVERRAIIMSGGDTRQPEIKQMWADNDVLKGYARLVEELRPTWRWIKANVDATASMSLERQQEWASDMWERDEIKPFTAKHPRFTKDVLARAVDSTISKAHREPVPLACHHAALEFEVSINGEYLTIIDAHLKYEGKKPSPSTLVSYYRTGCTLLKQSE